MTRPLPRRARLRQATIEEIKAVAHAQLTERGAAGLSLRAVARAMGMTPSAIYRYFDSRAALISVLARDAFSSLADTLEAAFQAAPADDHMARWLLVARSHRQWAKENRTEYTLIFGPQPDDVGEHSTAVLDELERSVAVLCQCMTEAIEAGLIDQRGLDAELTPRLRERLETWEYSHLFGPAAGAACMLIWTQLHGLLALELFGHLPEPLADSPELFDHQMINTLARIGYTGPVDFAAVIERADHAAVPPAAAPAAPAATGKPSPPVLTEPAATAKPTPPASRTRREAGITGR